jgi:sugar phosphate isomerase/epimerase
MVPVLMWYLAFVMLTRRSLLASAAALPVVAAAKAKKIPVGLELYSVRNELTKDLEGTVKAVAKMGYEGVEFYSPYFSWTADKAKDVRKLLDDLKIQCYSTHNDARSFATENIAKAIELNNILGAKIVVMASAGRVNGADGWKAVAETLTRASEKMKSAGLRAGFHNHQTEWQQVEGQRPMDILAKNTPKDVVLQLDVGTCIEANVDPVAWITSNPGRFASIHCKDYSPEKDKGYKVLFGEGAAPWKKIFEAAEKKGGVEYYLIEQEGAAVPPFDAAAGCLTNFRKLRR